MGGEKPPPYDQLGRRAGSPPRGRGKGLRRHQQDRGPGITPAWAGKSHAVHSPSHGAGDHPRVGGEKHDSAVCVSVLRGSPPRGRGKVTLPRRPPAAAGITPAWAGKREFQQLPEGGLQDHPRVGGEKKGEEKSTFWVKGSPPRGRGKADRCRPAASGWGITPAWAGKRPGPDHRRPGSQDHPRVGGEKRNVRNSYQRKQGSPPRGRGKDKGF